MMKTKSKKRKVFTSPAQKAAQILGEIRTRAKAVASRENGKKGGRPKKVKEKALT